MKKLIILSLLLPFLASASSVSIGDITAIGGNFTANGSASYTGLDTLSVILDSVNSLLSGSTANSWNVSGSTKAGAHTLTANVGSATASKDFVVGNLGGGLSPCQIAGTCPNFGLFAPVIPSQVSEKPKWHYVKAGEEGCPAWFYLMDCLVK